ncbi:hypothetical protein BDR26DRAFT_1007684 [Obelidium mucronatum]|nr:hypothetical protein BDR26DRAFT_1007684 [Obelidium mucronatum]
MGAVAVLFTILAAIGGLVYLLPRQAKRHVAVFFVRLTTPAPDASVAWKLKVLPHSASLKASAPNVFSLVGTLPANGPRLQRRMVVCRLADSDSGALWIHSPVCCSDDIKRAIAALGAVAWIVVPNEMHRLDAAAWAAAFPAAKVVCPRAARRRVAAAVRVDAACEDVFPEYAPDADADAAVAWVAPKGLYADAGELVYLLKHADSPGPTHSLVVADLFFNIDPAAPDVDPALITIGSACGFGCTAIGRFMFVKESAIARKWAETELAEIARKRKVTHVSLAHGDDLITKDQDSDVIVRALRKCASTFEKAHD